MEKRQSPSPAELSRFRIKVFNNFFERNYGRWRSNKVGDGTEFYSLKDYKDGDSYKKINWAASARTGRLIANQSIAERSARYHIIIDASSTMNFGSDRRKIDLVYELMQTILDLVSSNQDSIKITVLGEINTDYPLKNGKSASFFYKTIIKNLTYEKIDSNESFFKNYKNNQSAIVIFVSDFLDTDIFKSIEKFIIANKALPIHIYDPNEFSLPKLGIIRLKSYGSNKSFVIDTKDKNFISNYNSNVIHYKETLAKLLNLSRYGISISTSDEHAGKQFILKISKKSKIYAN